MSAHVAWAKGGEADFARADDDLVTLTSTRASAPGSRIEGTLAAGERVMVKIHRCRRLEGEAVRYSLEGRLLDATRAQRDAIAALVCGDATAAGDAT